MRRSRKFCQRGSNYDNVFFVVFLVYEGRADHKNTNSGPPSTRQRNAISMAFRWRVDGGPTLNASRLFVCIVALRPKSTAMVISGRSVHLTTLFPGQA